MKKDGKNMSLYGRDEIEMLDKHEPTSETEDKPFQVDNYGNFRIIVNSKESEWVSYSEVALLEHNGRNYFGVSKYFQRIFPTECVLRVDIYDPSIAKEQELLKNCIAMRIIDKSNGRPLSAKDIEKMLDVVLSKDEFDFFVGNVA